MSELKLQPKAVFDCFAEINKIPRPSHKEQKMGAFLVDFGKKHGLETLQDSTGNVLIRKPATKGMENLKTTVLQSHMDMVCEKEAGLNFDFEKDAIQTYIDGDWLKAKGTTLGADDGIGVAMQMAILADDTIQHGPGGANTKATFNVDLEDTPANQFFFKIQISGLTGGHSGDDIEKKRANANKLLARLLEAFKKYDIRIADIQSGGLHNAIPRDGYAVACVPTQFKENLRVDFNVMTAEFEEEFSATEQNMRFKLESTQPTAKVIDKTSGNNLITALVSVPNGVLAMDQNIPDFVETSSNLASIHLNKDKVNIVTSQRSNIMSARKNASAMVRGVFSLAGADAETGEGYPGWKLDPNSPLLSITVEAYKRLFAKDPEIRAIHAGLECGLFSLKYPHVDMVSFGPTLRGVHSPEERLLIPTVQKVWEHLLETLKNIPAK